MGLLSGGGGGLLRSVMAAFYLPGTVYNQIRTDLPGGEFTIAEVAVSAPMQFDALTERQRGQEGASDSDVRVLVLASDGVTVDTDCALSVSEGPYAKARYSVMDVGRDPCGAYHDCRARRQG